ncbi:MAG: phage scaffolding protein [Clostridia bacterium]|nr:phage scaffolding protein [Clostridia bacterium]
MKDFLTQLFGEAVTEEAFEKFNAELGKRFVAKSNYNSKLKEIESLEGNKKTLEKKIEELQAAGADSEKFKTELDALKKQIEDEKAAAEAKRADEELTESITAVFGDKKFTSDYVRNGIIADMKSEIAKPENKGKGYDKIFEELTKDKEGIFENPNQIKDMGGFSDVDVDVSEEQARAVMGLPPLSK